MYSVSQFEAEQDLIRFNDLINNKEYLTKEEYDFCVAWDSETSFKYLNKINSRMGYALNINVYSEAEHHESIFRMECGL